MRRSTFTARRKFVAGVLEKYRAERDEFAMSREEFRYGPLFRFAVGQKGVAARARARRTRRCVYCNARTL